MSKSSTIKLYQNLLFIPELIKTRHLVIALLFSIYFFTTQSHLKNSTTKERTLKYNQAVGVYKNENGILSVQFSSIKPTLTEIMIKDSQGKTLETFEEIPLQAGDTTLNIPVSTKGAYQLCVFVDEKLVYRKEILN